MRTTLLPIAEVGTPELERWRGLAAAAVEPNPYFEPEFLVPAAELLPGEPDLLVVTDAEGEWTGAMPLVRDRGWRRLPIRGYSRWRHDYVYFGSPLVRAGVEQAVFEAVLSGEDLPMRPFLGLDLLDAAGPVHAGLVAAAEALGRKPLVFEEHDRAALRRDADGLSIGLSSKRRHENRRLGRRLSEALGDEIEVVDRGEDPGAVEQFLELEASGWKGSQSTALASDPDHAEFFRRVCAGFRDAGRLQLLSLRAAGGRPAAIKCDLFAGDTIFCFKICFDESLAEFSPGVQLERALVDHEVDNERVNLIDTCAEAGNRMMNRVWPDRRRMVSLAVPGPGLGGTLTGLMVRASAQTRQMIRRSP